MIIRFIERRDDGDLYRVERSGEVIFLGKRAECLRFAAIHHEKTRRENAGSGRRRGPWTTLERAPWGPGVRMLGPTGS
jgi:hypothetical protein